MGYTIKMIIGIGKQVEGGRINMTTVLTHATIYTGNDEQPVIKDGYLRFGSKIEALGAMRDLKVQEGDEAVRCEHQVIVPGFIDVHTHGAYGFDTMDGQTDEVVQMARDQITEGITTVFPTTMTQSVANIDAAMQSVKEAAAVEPAIAGIHLEGPFISPHYQGAQPEQYIIAPNVELLAHWNELSGNMIKLITYAPEEAEDLPAFENYLLAHQIVG